VVTWNARILQHVKCRQGQNVLELFQQMQQESVQPDSVAFVGVLNACARKLPLKKVGVFISRLWNMDGIQMSLWGGVCWTFVKRGSMEDA
jgi:pentatricopeptide repeat protein